MKNAPNKLFSKLFITLYIFLIVLIMCIFTDLKWMYLIWIMGSLFLIDTHHISETTLKILLCLIIPLKVHLTMSFFISLKNKKFKGLYWFIIIGFLFLLIYFFFEWYNYSWKNTMIYQYDNMTAQ